MVINEQYIEHACAVWEKVGDCPLTNWIVKHSHLTYVRAEGTPPRCRKGRNHVFLFVNKWISGRKVCYLSTIGRREFFKPITWNGMNGQVSKGRVYRYFRHTETEVGQPLNITPA